MREFNSIFTSLLGRASPLGGTGQRQCGKRAVGLQGLAQRRALHVVESVVKYLQRGQCVVRRRRFAQRRACRVAQSEVDLQCSQRAVGL